MPPPDTSRNPPFIPLDTQQTFRIDSPGGYIPFSHPEAYGQWTQNGRTPPHPGPQSSRIQPGQFQQYMQQQYAGSHFETFGYPYAQHGSAFPIDRCAVSGPALRVGFDSSGNARLTAAPSRLFSSDPASRDGGSFHPAYVPPHRRVRSAPVSDTASTRPNPPLLPTSSTPLKSDSSVPSSPSRFVITLPSDEYLELSAGPATMTEEVVPKLLVLDLNGALVYRNRTAGSSASPRPYLGCFLQYLFLPDKATRDDRPPRQQARRPWEVFVWSSAQPHNVRAMIEAAFGIKWSEGIWDPEDPVALDERTARGEGRLLGVWARDRMNLDADQYNKKIQTVKDLREVIKHLNALSAHSYDQRTTVLLDDSPLKAVHQPWNQIPIPEYDKTRCQDSRTAAARLELRPDGGEEGLDETLLAVIGILEHLREVDNVPAWIRRGGLLHTDIDLTETTLETLPSHQSFKHWFDSPAVLQQWIERGRTALERQGVALEIGVPLEPPLPNYLKPRPSGVSGSSSRLRAWSPSRPASRSPTPGPESEASAPSPSPSLYEVPLPPRQNMVKPVDTWRTFKAAEVARYLQQLADHCLYNLSDIQCLELVSAAEVLISIAEGEGVEGMEDVADGQAIGEVWSDPSPNPGLHPETCLARTEDCESCGSKGPPKWRANMCDDCILKAGERTAHDMNGKAWNRAARAGMGKKAMAPPDVGKKRKHAGQGPQAKITSTANVSRGPKAELAERAEAPLSGGLSEDQEALFRRIFAFAPTGYAAMSGFAVHEAQGEADGAPSRPRPAPIRTRLREKRRAKADAQVGLLCELSTIDCDAFESTIQHEYEAYRNRGGLGRRNEFLNGLEYARLSTKFANLCSSIEERRTELAAAQTSIDVLNDSVLAPWRAEAIGYQRLMAKQVAQWRAWALDVVPERTYEDQPVLSHEQESNQMSGGVPAHNASPISVPLLPLTPSQPTATRPLSKKAAKKMAKQQELELLEEDGSDLPFKVVKARARCLLRQERKEKAYDTASKQVAQMEAQICEHGGQEAVDKHPRLLKRRAQLAQLEAAVLKGRDAMARSSSMARTSKVRLSCKARASGANETKLGPGVPWAEAARGEELADHALAWQRPPSYARGSQKGTRDPIGSLAETRGTPKIDKHDSDGAHASTAYEPLPVPQSVANFGPSPNDCPHSPDGKKRKSRIAVQDLVKILQREGEAGLTEDAERGDVREVEDSQAKRARMG